MIRSLPALFALTGLMLSGAASAKTPFYLGADLSYVNEMEDCGAVYRAGGKRVDPFRLMKERGGNIVRVRLWNDPKWTKYSNYADVLKTIRRAKAAKMEVLLDFHYSDDWADGDKQLVPAAWAKLGPKGQAKALYDFTRSTLLKLNAAGAMPELVQVGNETNPELMAGAKQTRINWTRNALLLNSGIRAVKDAGRRTGKMPRIMLHIAQPEHVLPWFDDATKAGVTGYDMIGISYYKKWSKWSLAQLGDTIAEAKRRYKADVMLVETAYPFSPAGEDKSPDLLGPDSLIDGYPATPAGQLKYLVDVSQLVADKGGVGVVYWEPAWVSTACKTRWGTGSNWENAAWFSLRDHEAMPAFDFLGREYRGKR